MRTRSSQPPHARFSAFLLTMACFPSSNWTIALFILPRASTMQVLPLYPNNPGRFHRKRYSPTPLSLIASPFLRHLSYSPSKLSLRLVAPSQAQQHQLFRLFGRAGEHQMHTALPARSNGLNKETSLAHLHLPAPALMYLPQLLKALPTSWLSLLCKFSQKSLDVP